MNVDSIGGSALIPDIQAQYAVKCLLMARQTTETIGNIIEDTVDISTEAMNKYLSELSN